MRRWLVCFGFGEADTSITTFWGLNGSGRVRTTTRKAEKIPNLRVLRVETSYAVQYLCPPDR